MGPYLSLDKEDIKNASVLRFPTTHDEFLIFEIYEHQKETRKYATDKILCERLEQEESLSRQNIKDALCHLGELGIVPREKDGKLVLPPQTLRERQLPDNYDISKEELKGLKRNRIREARNRLDTLKKMRVKTRNKGIVISILFSIVFLIIGYLIGCL